VVIVTGMHRSGTTFIGKVLEVSDYYYYIHEPLNFQYGVEGVPCWYPFLDVEGQVNRELRVLLDSLYNMKLKFKVPPSKGLNKFFRYFVRSRGHLDYLKYKAFSLFRKKEVLVKDPFLALSAAYLAHNYPDVKVIYIVRHPVAIYNSISRMKWKFDFNNILQQSYLVENYARDLISFMRKKDLPLWEEVALLWKVIYRVVYHHARILGTEKALVIKHEDFSLSPFETINTIFSFLGYERNSKVDSFIKENMFATSAKIDEKRLHNFKRNAREMAYAWRKRWKPEYDKILQLVGDEIKAFGYEDDKTDISCNH